MICGVIAGVIAISGTIPQFVGIFRGKVKPHLFTQLTNAVASLLMFYLLLAAGAGFSGAVSQLISAATYGALTILSIKFFAKLVRPVDLLVMIFVVIALAMWILFHNTNVGIYLLLTGTTLSFVPTLRKTWNLPWSESIASTLISLISRIFVVLSLASYTFPTLISTYVSVSISFLMLAIMLSRRYFSRKTARFVEETVEL